MVNWLNSKRNPGPMQAGSESRWWRMLVAFTLGLGLFGAGYALGSTAPARTVHAQAGTPDEAEALFEPFWEAWRLLHATYVNQPLDDTALMRGALGGMVDALDDSNTDYMDPETYALLNSDLSGQFEGIGVEMERQDDGSYVILTPLDGSPAEAAGMLPGDELVGVDGVDVRELEHREVIASVRGAAGTAVRLTLRRDGQPGTLDVLVVRDLIVIEDVEWRYVDGDIAYVRLTQFSSTAADNLETSLQEVMALQPGGMVLDLRGNPGGLLDVAIEITSEFIHDGPVMIERWGLDRERVYEADGSGLATEIPLVVLVDSGSASASELLAAAVQVRGRGTILGETTFGKGTVQNWHELNDGSGMRVTVARWHAPDGTWIHESGVQPDVVVEWPGGRAADVESDVQVNAAIEILRGEVLWPTWPLPWLDRVWPGVAG